MPRDRSSLRGRCSRAPRRIRAADLVFAQKMTLAGTLGLLISPPANLVFGIILISTYLRLQTAPIPHGSFFTRPWS